MQNGQTQSYATPRLERVGALEAVTLGTKTGNFTDAFFPVHTPKGKITFS